MQRLRSILSLALAATLLAAPAARACTIFVLVDEQRALFFNNEDWFTRTTRLWFVPAGPGHLGCAYVGFDNGWAQGGLNTEGLAFDWVAGYEEKYQPAPGLKPVRGNSSERMLESCRTVDEAIAFYRTHQETSFHRGRILIADRTGASVAIGARNGELHVVKMNRSRGFGYGNATLVTEIPKVSATVENGAAILRACEQPGDGGTKYANVFDLKTGEIFLFPQLREAPVVLSLAAELAKGGHYYDIPRLRPQLAEPPRPLLNNMRRFFLDEFKPLADQEPAVTARVRKLLQDTSAGNPRSVDYTPEFWARLSPRQKEYQTEIARLGDVVAITLVGRNEEKGLQAYRYLVEFAQERVLGRYVFDAQGRVALIQTEGRERKPDLATAP